MSRTQIVATLFPFVFSINIFSVIFRFCVIADTCEAIKFKMHFQFFLFMFYDVDFVYFQIEIQLNLEIYGSQKALKFQLFFVTL